MSACPCNIFHTFQLILHLVENYPVPDLRKIILDENDIDDSTKLTINQYIDDNGEDDDVSIQTMDSKAEALGTSSRKVTSKSKSGKHSKNTTSTEESASGSEEEETESEESDTSESSTMKFEKAKDNESELKDTVKTDEDYKALEQALEEAGQSTGKISALSGTMETNDSDEEAEMLTEIPVISTTPVLTMVKTTSQKVEKSQLDDDDDESEEESGEELHEVYLR